MVPCAQFGVVGTAGSVLIREVSCTQGILYREAPPYGEDEKIQLAADSVWHA